MALEDWTMLVAGVTNNHTVTSKEFRANLRQNAGLPSNLSSFFH